VRTVLFLVASLPAFAQLTFEVASVKRADPAAQKPGSAIMRGGPGTADPERITFISTTLERLLMIAYGVQADQVAGPRWLPVERYAISANVPPGATKSQVQEMLQSLLKDRFQVVVHRGIKVLPAYDLSVAKDGSKLRESSPGANPTRCEATMPNLDKNGLPLTLPGQFTKFAVQRVAYASFNGCALSDLIRILAMPLNVAPARIVDRTGLHGTYEFYLQFAGNFGPAGAFADSPGTIGVADLFGALEIQLGLKLEEKKLQVDGLIVDRAEKIPTQN
jgi:uncharacterized protein (TIGR03435 family)